MSAAGLGQVLDWLSPPPNWRDPEFFGPSPISQTAAQAAEFLENWETYAYLNIIEHLADLERELDEHGVVSVTDPIADPPATAARPPGREEPPEPEWQPEDPRTLWSILTPAERQQLGLRIEPRDGLPVPEGLWPLGDAWRSYRQRPTGERVLLEKRLRVLIRMPEAQRQRLLASHRRWLGMSAEEQAHLLGEFTRARRMQPLRLRQLEALYKHRNARPPSAP